MARLGYLLGGILLLFSLIPVALKSEWSWAAKVELQYFSELKHISDILRLVQARFVDKETVSNQEKLIEGSIEGILKKLDDPFSRYMPAEVHSSMQEETQGEFGGLGILLGIRDEILTVISPMESTPAFRAGIRSQDQLIKINDTSTEGMSVEAAVKLLRGKPGTSVAITIRRDQEILAPIQITRDFIKVPSVKAGKLSTGIGYARIASFSASTGADLDLEIDKMEAVAPLAGLVLDLRGNPGGLLSAAVEVAQDLLGNGKTIVSIRGRDTEDTVFNSQSQKIREWPLVVLIDGGSASASEIVAGAIKDNKRGVLIGTKSYGKGSVQTVMPLPNGAALALTTAYYYTPAGVKIHKIGITPDIEVAFPKLSESQLQEYRETMEKSVNQTHQKTREKQEAYLGSQVSSEASTTALTSAASTGSESSTYEFLPISEHDTQLARALDVITALQILREKKR